MRRKPKPWQEWVFIAWRLSCGHLLESGRNVRYEGYLRCPYCWRKVTAKREGA